MRKPRAMLATAVGLTIVVAIGAILGIGCREEARPESISVPIEIVNAANVGSIGFELVYDAAIVKAVKVEAGDLAANAMIEYNIDTPGLIRVGIIDTQGMNGDGSVVRILFNIFDDSGSSTMTLANTKAHDAGTLIDIPHEASQGNVEARGEIAAIPTIIFNP